MRKVIGAINMTLDGFCDHTAVLADDELHQHYSNLLKNGGVILYGRITYQLMEYWPSLVKNPSGDKASDEFAVIIDRIPKIVFSNTLKNVEWETARVATGTVKEEIQELKQQPGKDILIGSRSLIVHCLNHNLIDEFQLCVHPVIARTGLPLLDSVDQNLILQLAKTKTLGSGAVILYYEPGNRNNTN